MLYLLFISRYEGGDVRFLKIYGEKKKLWTTYQIEPNDNARDVILKSPSCAPGRHNIF
jgi:hypothetical protein